MVEIKEALEMTLERMRDESENSYGFPGVPSGLKDLDGALRGFDDSDLIVVGARPAMGKTAFMLTLALNMAERGIPVLFYSLEMSDVQIVSRMLSNITDIDGIRLREGLLTTEEFERVFAATTKLSDYPIYIDDKCSWHIEEFCKKVRDDVGKTGAKVVLIDYLQLFSSAEKCQNRYEEVALCTRQLKRLAREANIPVIVSSQLNRNVEHRPSERPDVRVPQMFDLRDSGTICEDANVVLLLHRPEYYLRSDVDNENRDIRGLVEVIIAKNHMGPYHEVKLEFHPETCRFNNWRESHLNTPLIRESPEPFIDLDNPGEDPIPF